MLDATLLFLIQVLIAQHPELLAPPDEPHARRPATPLRAAQHILDAVREVHYALDNYRAFLPAAPRHPTDTSTDGDDDIPF
jgi:hypothetical protein